MSKHYGFVSVITLITALCIFPCFLLINAVLFEEYSFSLSRGQVEHIFFQLLCFLPSLSLVHVKRMDLPGSVLSGHSLFLFISVNIWCQSLLLYKASAKQSLSGEMELPYTPFLCLFLAQALTIFHLFSLLRESQDLTVFNSSDYLELCSLLCLGTLLLFPQNYVSIPLIFCYSLWIEVIWLFALNIVLKFWESFFVPHLFFFSNCTVLNSLFELANPFFHLIQSCYVCLLLFF